MSLNKNISINKMNVHVVSTTVLKFPKMHCHLKYFTIYKHEI